MNQPQFDPAERMVTYRRIISGMDAATTAFEKASFSGIARRLRAEWMVWRGEDSLHESAFGEPE
jgi:hypothetical protein